jgi:atypical dual specificity phosphatase
MSAESDKRTLLSRIGAWLRMEWMAGDGRMRGFYWLAEGELAGCGRPGGRRDDAELLERDLTFLREQGIGALLSLTETPLSTEALERHGFATLHLPVEDLTPPTPDQLQDALAFIDFHVNQGTPVAVHCLVGHGRTGTVLAARLIRDGVPLADALDELRTLSPGAVGSASQERALAEWERQRGWIL